jgi:hypothetical protein
MDMALAMVYSLVLEKHQRRSTSEDERRNSQTHSLRRQRKSS